MTDHPVVSVLMPVYNHERYVVEAIESALLQAQHYPADCLDIVLVDDGSTDRTPELYAPYADRIRIVRKPNGGVLSTVNRLLDEARGDLLCFLAGDDAWLPQKVARQAAVLAQRPWVSMVYGDSRLIDGDGQVIHPSYYDFHGLPRPLGDVRGPLLERQVLCAPTVMLRAALRERFAPIVDPAVWEDWWMWTHAAQAGDALYVSGVDVSYRVHGANMHAGIAGDEQLRFTARELPFRRWLLTETDLEGIPHADVVSAWRAFEWHARSCAAGGIAPLDELVPVTAEQAAGAEDELRLAGLASTPSAAVGHLVRALIFDPHHGAARAQLPGAIEAADRAAPPAQVRSAVVLALANELVHDPALLAGYAAAHGPQDDVTLVIDAGGWSSERVGAELVPVVAGLGLLEDGPDLLVITDGRSWPRERLVGVLTRDAGTAEALGAPVTGGTRVLAAA